MLCRYRGKSGIKQYTFGHKVYKFPSDEWTSVNDIRLFKALQSYSDVFDTLCFFDLNPFLLMADKITFKKDLVFTTSKVIADKLNGMAYVRQQAYKPEIGEWIFKILGYSTENLATYQETGKIVNILAHRDLGGIGDIIMTTSVIEEAVKEYSHYKITYACPDQFLPLLENNPFITGLESINSDVTKKDWDVVIDLTSDCIKHEMKNQPDVKLNRAEIFAQKCGLPIETVPRPKIYLSEEEILGAKEELKDFKLKIGLVLKSKASVRNWPYFKELRTKLSKKYPQATFLEFSIKKPAGWKSIKQSYEVYGKDLRKVSSLINECDVVISPDTGLAHIASALRVPTVWIFTHIDGKIRTKNYDGVEICQKTPKNCSSKGIPCWYAIPCSQGEIERKKNPLCSLGIKPDYVLSKVDKILSRPNISYCVVYKDNEEITKECVSRILKYRKYNNELVLVDNGSQNRNFLNALLKNQQSVVRIRNKKNEGCIIARNQAMKKARGGYLFTLDNDQYISAVSIHRLLNTEGDIVGVEGWSMDKDALAFDIKENKGELAYVGAGGMLVKRKIAEEVKYFNETYSPAWFEDPDFCFKAKRKGFSIVYCKNAKIKHLQHQTINKQTNFDSQKIWKRNHGLFKKIWVDVLNKKKNRILFIADVFGWAWWNKAMMLKKYLSDEFIIDCSVGAIIDPSYDIYFTFCPSDDEKLNGISKNKRITGITSHLDFDRYIKNVDSDFYKSRVFALHANSKTLVNLIKPYHDKIFYVPNGVDTNLFKYCDLVKKDELVVGFVGKHNTAIYKGFYDFIDPAVQKVKGAKVKTNFYDYKNKIPQAELFSFYKEIDVYVVASVAEGTPNPMLEAAACGRPIIANRVGNAPEFVEHGENGFLIDRNIDEYVKAIQYFKDNPSEIKRMGLNARKQAELWEWKKQAKNYLCLFKDLIG